MKLILMLILSFTFVGCSQQRLAMRFADTATSWKVDDYFDLNGAQKDQVKKQFKTFLQEIYESNEREIPQIFEQADRLLANAEEAKKLDCGEVEKISVQISKVFAGLGKLSVPHVRALTESLSQKQINHFLKEVAKNIEDDERELKKPQVQEEERLERSLKFMKQFFGSLSKEQESAIKNHVKTNPFSFEEQLKSRKVNFEKLKAVSGTTETFNKFVLDYVQNWRAHQTSSYLKNVDELRSQNEKFYQNLICEASDKQLKKFRQKISSVKKDFEEFFVKR